MGPRRHGTLRLGDLLVVAGVISVEQRDEILEHQRRAGRPFGELAESLFGVSPRAVEAAWAQQVSDLTDHTDPRHEKIEPEALAMVVRRQAWQFCVLPLRFCSGELVVCTTQEDLPRALKFVAWRIPTPCRFVLAEPRAMGEALEKFFPMGGMSAASLSGRRIAS